MSTNKEIHHCAGQHDFRDLRLNYKKQSVEFPKQYSIMKGLSTDPK